MRDFKQSISTLTGLSRFKEIDDRKFILKRGDRDCLVYYLEDRFSLSDLNSLNSDLELGFYNYVYVVFFDTYKQPISIINLLVETYGLGVITVPSNIKQPEVDLITINGKEMPKMDSSHLLDYISVKTKALYQKGTCFVDDSYTLFNNFYRDRTKLFSYYASEPIDETVEYRILLRSNNRLKVHKDFLEDDFSNLYLSLE